MQEPGDKRRLLNFVFSNCSWKGGELQAEYKQAFNLLAVTTATYQAAKAAGCQSNGLSENWLPVLEAFRTFCLDPNQPTHDVFKGLSDIYPISGRYPISSDLAEG